MSRIPGSIRTPALRDAKGADRFGGTRVGQENVVLSSEGSISGRRLATPRWCQNLAGHPPLFSQRPTIWRSLPIRRTAKGRYLAANITTLGMMIATILWAKWSGSHARVRREVVAWPRQGRNQIQRPQRAQRSSQRGRPALCERSFAWHHPRSDAQRIRISPAGWQQGTDEETLSRLRKLAIPPAYEEVWICCRPNGHLQPVGRYARGRKSTATILAGVKCAIRQAAGVRQSSADNPSTGGRESVAAWASAREGLGSHRALTRNYPDAGGNEDTPRRTRAMV